MTKAKKTPKTPAKKPTPVVQCVAREFIARAVRIERAREAVKQMGWTR